MCGLAGVNLCVLVCDWSTGETGYLLRRIYTPCTGNLTTDEEPFPDGHVIWCRWEIHDSSPRRAWPAVIYMAPTNLNRLVLSDRHKIVNHIHTYAERLFISLCPSVCARVKKKNWRTTQRIFMKFGTGKSYDKNSSRVISGFRRSVHEIFTLLGSYAA